MRKTIICVIILFVSGCAGSPVWNTVMIDTTTKEAKKNNEKTINLKIGQSTQEIIKMMGNPAKREVYPNVEFFFYRTTGWSLNDMGDRDYQFTPLAFEDDKLVGWGRNYYDMRIKQVFEIK
ncbi:MAG: DUF3192 domain-containing protein [Nitrospinota bacterium]